MNGHFVHYFAPKDLPVVPKNVVFLIDTSASMLGKKIRQVRAEPGLLRWGPGGRTFPVPASDVSLRDPPPPTPPRLGRR